jgi:epoxyqueuosine reductase
MHDAPLSSDASLAADEAAPDVGETPTEVGLEVLAQLRQMAAKLGFSQIGVAGVDLSSAEAGLLAWLQRGFHGEMHYMASHGLKRARPAELVPGTVRVITARMDYLPASVPEGWQAIEWQRLKAPEQAADAALSIYARGRDYHKVMRARLQKLAEQLAERVGPLGHRVFTDSAPVLEVELASRSGLGWRGKHTLLLSRQAGSTFFLGEIYVDLALPLTEPESSHCGSCTSCMDLCPTGAIVGEKQVDARLCISYLTIEHPGEIPEALRPLIGNRSMGVTTVSWPAPGTSSPSELWCLISTCALPCSNPPCCSCGPGTKTPSCARPKAAPFDALALAAGSATWRWPWATPCAKGRAMASMPGL